MKRVADTDLFEPGCIYELQVCVDGEWYAFYVGETTDPDRRLAEHQWAARNATESSTLVYRTIKQQFEPAGCEWRMQPVHAYGAEGPEDAEDEHIMMLLRQGVTLTNEKKGNANWMTQRVAEAANMVERNITSYKKYREVITQEQANARHAGWDTQHKRSLPEDFYNEIGVKAEQRRQREIDRKERQARRDAEVAAVRVQQEAEWQEQVKRMMASYGKTDDAV
jgi:hypothetical protein